MTQTPVEIDIVPDLTDYRRAALQMLMMRRPFQLLLLLTALAVVFALFMVARNTPTAGLSRAALEQAPILMFGILPLAIYGTLLWQGKQMVAQQQKVHERTHYSFTENGFEIRITADEKTHEGGGEWTAFTRVVETEGDFMLFLPGSVGIFLPKRCYKSPEDIQLFREYARKALGQRARVRA